MLELKILLKSSQLVISWNLFPSLSGGGLTSINLAFCTLLFSLQIGRIEVVMVSVEHYEVRVGTSCSSFYFNFAIFIWINSIFFGAQQLIIINQWLFYQQTLNLACALLFLQVLSSSEFFIILYNIYKSFSIKNKNSGVYIFLSFSRFSRIEDVKISRKNFCTKYFMTIRKMAVLRYISK